VVDLVPDQALEAEQVLALVADQVSVAVPLYTTDSDDAFNVTVGAGGAATTTVTFLLVLPPGPVQDRVKVLSAVSEPIDRLPEVVFAPDQASLAVHELASLDDQDRVVAPL
jgi:hypothetical protein